MWTDLQYTDMLGTDLIIYIFEFKKNMFVYILILRNLDIEDRLQLHR